MIYTVMLPTGMTPARKHAGETGERRVERVKIALADDGSRFCGLKDTACTVTALEAQDA